MIGILAALLVLVPALALADAAAASSSARCIWAVAKTPWTTHIAMSKGLSRIARLACSMAVSGSPMQHRIMPLAIRARVEFELSDSDRSMDRTAASKSPSMRTSPDPAD